MELTDEAKAFFYELGIDPVELSVDIRRSAYNLSFPEIVHQEIRNEVSVLSIAIAKFQDKVSGEKILDKLAEDANIDRNKDRIWDIRCSNWEESMWPLFEEEITNMVKSMKFLKLLSERDSEFGIVEPEPKIKGQDDRFRSVGFGTKELGPNPKGKVDNFHKKKNHASMAAFFIKEHLKNRRIAWINNGAWAFYYLGYAEKPPIDHTSTKGGTVSVFTTACSRFETSPLGDYIGL